MARDPRWHRGGILTFLAIQFILALAVLVINAVYWAKYGGVVYSSVIQSPYPSEPSYDENIYQVTEPLNMYIFGISCATIGLVAIETIAYFSKSLHPAFCIVVNIALFLGWCGCLAVYFVWGGGLEYTGAAWISQYNSFCNLGNPPVADSVEYIYTVTCGGEKILLIMLPFVCLNILLYPIFTIFVLVTAILHYSRKGRPGYPQQSGPTAPPSHPAYGMAPQQQQAVPMQGENARFSANQSSMSPTTTMTTTTPPQPFVHQGVLYQPIAIAQPGYGQSPMELSGHAAPMREMAGQGVKVELGSEGVDQKGDAYQKE